MRWILASFLILSNLIPYHGYPFLTFYQELLAFFLGTVLISSILLKEKLSLFPYISVSLVCLSLLYLCQTYYVTYPVRNLIPIAYCLWGATIAWAGATVKNKESVVDTIAISLCVGGFLIGISGFVQYFQIDTFFGTLVQDERTEGMYGIIAQRNMFANYIACSFLGIIYLWNRSLVTVRWLLAILFTLCLFYSGSRTVWIYLILISIFANFTDRKILILVLGYIILSVIPNMSEVSHQTSVIGYPDAINSRFLLWIHSIIQFVQCPILGCGFGEFGYKMLQNTLYLDGHYTPGIDRNAHNIFLHTLAETGGIGCAILITGIICWGRNQSLQSIKKNSLIYALLGIQLIHSLVEFPLWYSQNLGLTMLLLGLTSSQGIRLNSRILSVLVISSSLLFEFSYLRGYRSYEVWYQVASKSPDIRRQVSKLLNLKQSWMLAPMFDLVVAELLEVSAKDLKLKMQVNEKAMHVFPIPSTVAREVKLLELVGRKEEAALLYKKFRIVYPTYKKESE